MRCSLACLLVTSGCLSRPVGMQGDAGVWPVSGVVIRGTLAHDLDGDGTPDLVLMASDGVYVLRGGSGFGTAYHAFVATPSAPLAIDVADLGGGAAPELAVLGTGPGGIARVRIYEGTAGFGFATTGWPHDITELTPKDVGRRGVRLLDSDGDGARNILAYDAGSMYIGQPAMVSAQAVSDLTLVRAEGQNTTYFTAIGDLFTLPGASAGKADLVVDDYHRVSIFRGDGLDLYPDAAREDLVVDGMYDVSAHADLDGDGVPEIVGGYNGFLTGNALASPPHTLAYAGMEIPNHAVVVSIGARFGQLDRDPSAHPDLLLMRHTAESGTVATGTELVLIRNLVATSTSITPNAAPLARVIPELLVGFEVGDFDHDGATEIIAVAASGALTCLRYGDVSLDPC